MEEKQPPHLTTYLALGDRTYTCSGYEMTDKLKIALKQTPLLISRDQTSAIYPLSYQAGNSGCIL